MFAVYRKVCFMYQHNFILGGMNFQLSNFYTLVSTDARLHLAPGGQSSCDYGVPIDQSECEAAVRSFAQSAGEIPKKSMQVGHGGSCLDGGWGQVPLGCSAQSGSEWTAHYKTGGNVEEGCTHQHYQLVCAFTGNVYFWNFV